MAERKTAPTLPVWNETEMRLWTARALLQAVDITWSAAEPYACLQSSTGPLAFALGVDRGEIRSLVGSERTCWASIAERLHARALGLTARHASVPNLLDASLGQLNRYMELDAVETALLKLSVGYFEHEAFRDAIGALGDSVGGRLHSVFAGILGVERTRVACAVGDFGTLSRVGLLRVDERGGKLWLHSPERLVRGLLRQPFDFAEVFAGSFGRAGAPRRTIRDFDYLGGGRDAIVDLLSGAVGDRTRGINVLLHGEPGTGKTELVLALAKRIGCEAYVIASQRMSGMPQDRDDRFRAYALAQRALHNSGRALIVFDDCEDVFEESFGFGSNQAPLKAWVNGLLETNEVPAIWIGNRMTWIDPAYLRRFLYTFEMPAPPAGVRRRLLADALGALPGADPVVARAARIESLTPADIERVKSALDLVPVELDGQARLDRAVEVLRGRYKAPSRGEIVPGPLDGATPPFEPPLINTDLDVVAVVRGIRRTGCGRLLFHGPPGTGKTAFAHHLAESADRDLQVISASDWLHPFVGMTERLMRRDFERAAQRGAVLFIDEADTFLRSRRGAAASWEVSDTNELLKRLETTRAVVILATNLMEEIDTAVLRRLEVKARFGYLRADQSLALFRLALGHLRGRACRMPARVGARLRRIENLAGGDFAAAARRLVLLGGEITATRLMKALEEEVAAKPDLPRRIGFV